MFAFFAYSGLSAARQGIIYMTVDSGITVDLSGKRILVTHADRLWVRYEITGTPTLKILIKEASLLLLFHMGITI